MSIDVLIPVANGIEFLFEAIQSVVAQTFTDWNCWIILNGPGLSKDAKTVAKAVSVIDSRIHVLESYDAKNKCDALNDAVMRTNAPWIALLDVDDRWLPTKLQIQMEAAMPDMAVIGTDARYFGELTGNPHIPTGWIEPPKLLTVNPLINSSTLIRRPLAYWSYSPNDEAKNMDDYYLWMRLALQGHRFFNCPQVLTEHRIHRQSAFNSKGSSPAPLQAWYRSQLT